MDKIRIKETNFCFIMIMFAYVVLSVILAVILPQKTPYWLSRCLEEMIFVLPLIVFLVAKKTGPISILSFSKIGLWDVLLSYVAAYCLLPFIMLLNYLTSLFAHNYVGGMMMDVCEYPFVLQLFLMAVMPAVVEEYMFRGFFYGSYRRCGVLKGALMSGLVFGMAHLNINQFAYAFFMGAVFCIIYEVSGNVILPMISHFAVNAHTVVMMYISGGSAVQELSETAMLPEDAAAVTTFGTALVLMVLAVPGIIIFCIILNKLAKMHGRLNLREIFKNDKMNNTDVESGSIMDVGMAAFVIVVFAYMFLIEI